MLGYFLQATGFCFIERVGSFNLFQDTSELIYRGIAISLNMAAKKCEESVLPGADGGNNDGFRIDHNANPYVRK
jgi:hypothetical protein